MADPEPLFAPGIHRLSLAELEPVAVVPYPASIRRGALFQHLGQWLDALRARGAQGRCWLDGSFLTTKIDPEDIDLVIFPTWATEPTAAVQAELGSLFDQALVKVQYGLDVYLVPPGPAEVQMASYWRGWFGFCRDGVTAKGIVEIQL